MSVDLGYCLATTLTASFEAMEDRDALRRIFETDVHYDSPGRVLPVPYPSRRHQGHRPPKPAQQLAGSVHNHPTHRRPLCPVRQARAVELLVHQGVQSRLGLPPSACSEHLPLEDGQVKHGELVEVGPLRICDHDQYRQPIILIPAHG